MTAQWMLYFLPISIWFAASASAAVTAALARRRDDERQQERLHLAFSRARASRIQGFSPLERSDWR